jgi:hypothetical protein
LQKWWNTFQVKEEDKESRQIINQWTEDYKLIDWGPRGLCPEYLEMGEFSILFLFYVGVFICSSNGSNGTCHLFHACLDNSRNWLAEHIA